MSLSVNVAEHWTWSGRALVVTVDTETARTLVRELDLSEDAAVRVNQNRLAIALWGDALESYMQVRDNVLKAAAKQSSRTLEFAPA